MDKILSQIISVAIIYLILWWIFGVKRKTTLKFLKRYLPSAAREYESVLDIQDGTFNTEPKLSEGGVTYAPSVPGVIFMGILFILIPLILGVVAVTLVPAEQGLGRVILFLIALAGLIFGLIGYTRAGFVINITNNSINLSSLLYYLFSKRFKQQIKYTDVSEIKLIPEIAATQALSHNFKVVISSKSKNKKLNFILFSPPQIKAIVSLIQKNESLKNKVKLEKPSF